ncbi:MAG TPA: putative ABC transporter permease, partial [Methanocorpusculum sp.]|nr:putative ABC transporter permease [Methanocorpusculum sp.]
MPDIITLFLWFILYGFLGWVWETSFCSIRAKHFINRGFLNGPIIPVYGFGAVFVIIALSLSAPIIPV